jgi:hypothetical protein
MSLLSRLLGKKPAPAASNAPPIAAAEVSAPSQENTVIAYGQGDFELPIVGESYYQDNLERICGGRTRESCEIEKPAVLILEDDNPKDPRAVRVEIEGLKVGYLSRGNARRYRETFADVFAVSPRMQVCAMIRGGWDRGPDDRGHFGVWLDLAVEDTEIHIDDRRVQG